jgi:hypothetical protein
MEAGDGGGTDGHASIPKGGKIAPTCSSPPQQRNIYSYNSYS